MMSYKEKKNKKPAETYHITKTLKPVTTFRTCNMRHMTVDLLKIIRILDCISLLLEILEVMSSQFFFLRKSGFMKRIRIFFMLSP